MAPRAFETKYSQSSKKGMKFSHSEIEFLRFANPFKFHPFVLFHENSHKSNSQLHEMFVLGIICILGKQEKQVHGNHTLLHPEKLKLEMYHRPPDGNF